MKDLTSGDENEGIIRGLVKIIRALFLDFLFKLQAFAEGNRTVSLPCVVQLSALSCWGVLVARALPECSVGLLTGPNQKSAPVQ